MEKGYPKILVADDNPDILKLIEINLKFEGYETITADNGEKALELALKEKPGLIILDVLMPGMDGWQVLGHLKNRRETMEIPVIFLTGVSMKEGKERGLIEGVEDYLSKPFNPLRLLEMVEEILSRQKISPPRKEPASEKIGIGIIGGEKAPLKLARMLMGTPSVNLMAYCTSMNTSTISGLMNELQIPRLESPQQLLELPEISMIIDTRQMEDSQFQEQARKRDVKVVQGLTIDFIQGLMEDHEAGRLKEKSLVKELNTRVKELSILNEMSQILTSPLDPWLLMEKISSLSVRVSRMVAGALFIYDEESEKFAVSNLTGLSDNFKNRVRLPLSDAIIEEMIALRRPLVVSKLQDWGISGIIRGALEEGMKSMIAVPLTSKDKLMGLIAVFCRESREFDNETVGLLSILSRQASVAIENANLYESTRQKQLLVEKLLSKLIQAQEEERKRMAAELHDTIAQSLVGILTKVQTCQALLKKAPEKISGKLEELKNVVGENVKEVREIIFNLRPSSLDDLGLIASLENYIKRFERETSIEVEFMINIRELRLPTTVETAMFRLIQEALTNVKKHSKAGRVMIKLNLEPNAANLRIADNGAGFEWESVTERFLRGDSHGLQGMKERVSLLGGDFRVITEKGKGCIVRARIPLARKKEDSILDTVSKILGEAGKHAQIGNHLTDY